MPFDDACRRWKPEVGRAIPTADNDFIDELTAHVSQRWLDALNRGLTEAGADEMARRELEAWRHTAPPARRPGRHPFIGQSLDWRHALRMIRWRPAFAVSATVLLAIGVAGASTMTAVVYGVLGRSLPYPQPDRLMTVWTAAQNGTSQISWPDAQDLAATGAFEQTAMFSGGVGTFSGGASVERVNTLFAEPAMLSMLGAQASRGRLLTKDDTGTDNAVISARLWRTQFGSSDDIIGRRFQMSGGSLTIVGVLAPGFDFEVPVARTFFLSNHDVWTPFDGPGEFAARRDVTSYQMLARLAPAVSLQQARSAADATASALAAQHPATNRDRGFAIIPLHEIIVESSRASLWLSAAGALLLVLAALANLGGLALARAGSRGTELTVRRALGATSAQLVRQLTTEQVPLVAGGLTLGLLAGRLATLALMSAPGLRLPRPDAVQFDELAWMSGVVIALAAWVILAAAPLFGIRGTVPTAAGRVAGAASRRPRQVLVIAEIAMALVLCVTAALVADTLQRLASADAGFNPDGRLTFRVSAYATEYPDKARVIAFFNEVAVRLQSMPGVEAVAASSSLPLSGQFSGIGVLADGESPTERVTAGWQHVTPDYFDASGVALLRGQPFTGNQRGDDRHVSIISEGLARRLFGTIEVIGRRIQSGGGTDWHEIVGVAEDVRHRSLRDADDRRVYDLTGQHWGRTMYFVLRGGATDAPLIGAAVRRAIGEVSRSAPLFEMSTGIELLRRSVAVERLASIVSASVALLALVLAAFGIHAVVACSVAERRREMAVRLALGATRGRVASLIMGEAGVLAAGGWVIGLALSMVAVRGLSSVIPDLGTRETWSVVTTVCVVVMGAGIAAAGPAARRATLVDPARVLSDGSNQ